MLHSDVEPTDVGLKLVLIRKITSEIKVICIRHVQGLNRSRLKRQGRAMWRSYMIQKCNFKCT